MSEKSVRLQITLRPSVPAEKAVLDLLSEAETGIARQHLLRDILVRGVNSMSVPAAVTTVVQAPVRAPVRAPERVSVPMPTPEPAPAVKSRKPLADLM